MSLAASRGPSPPADSWTVHWAALYLQFLIHFTIEGGIVAEYAWIYDTVVPLNQLRFKNRTKLILSAKKSFLLFIVFFGHLKGSGAMCMTILFINKKISIYECNSGVSDPSTVIILVFIRLVMHSHFYLFSNMDFVKVVNHWCSWGLRVLLKQELLWDVNQQPSDPKHSVWTHWSHNACQKGRCASTKWQTFRLRGP